MEKYHLRMQKHRNDFDTLQQLNVDIKVSRETRCKEVINTFS